MWSSKDSFNLAPVFCTFSNQVKKAENWASLIEKSPPNVSPFFLPLPCYRKLDCVCLSLFLDQITSLSLSLTMSTNGIFEAFPGYVFLQGLWND